MSGNRWRQVSWWSVESEPADNIDEEDVLLWDDSPEGQPTTGEQLSDSQRQQLQDLLKEFSDVMQNKLGLTDLTEHKIDTGSANPVRLPPYRLPHAYRATVRSELKEMLERGIIEKSSSEWAAPIVLVKKKDGSIRMCVDYRRCHVRTLIRCHESMTRSTGWGRQSSSQPWT